MKQLTKRRSWILSKWRKNDQDQPLSNQLSDLEMNRELVESKETESLQQAPSSFANTSDSSTVSSLKNFDSISLFSTGTTKGLTLSTSFNPSPLVNTYSGIPSSRLTLQDHSQRLAYELIISEAAKTSEYENEFYFSWNVWSYKKESWDRELVVNSIVATPHDHHLFFTNELQEILREGRKVHIFRSGFMPVKRSLDEGYTIEIQVESDLACLFFEKMSKFILSNKVYSSMEAILISICGITFKQLEHYAVLSLWIHPLHSSLNKDPIVSQMLQLLECLRYGLTDFLPLLERVILMDNGSLQTTVIDAN